jgi:hypothetical protein
VKSFTFFQSYYSATEGMSRSARDRWLGGIIAYAFDGIEPDFSGELLRLFVVVRPHIDISKARSDATSKPNQKQDSTRHQKKVKRESKRESKRNQTPSEEEEVEVEEEERDKPPYPLFDAFWAAYPRKTGKGAARKSWDRLGPDRELAEAIIAAVRAQERNPQWLRDDGRFIPHPATWLNQRRWEDEAEGGGHDYDAFKRTVSVAPQP